MSAISAAHLVRGLGLVLGLALAVACQPSAAPSSAPGREAAGPRADEWNQLIEAAKKEGQVSVYAFAGAPYREALVEAFERAYSGIKVNATFAPAPELVTRVTTERTSEQYLVDIFINGTGPSLTTLKPAGALADLKAALVLPEVVDESKWFENKLWWADQSQPYTTLMYQGSVQPVVFYNTNLVNPNEFSSYYDLLNPKWKGKMTATDVRRPGPGGVTSRWWYKEPQLGPPFMERLFSEMDLTLSSDQRQMIDWVAQGQYPVGLLLFGAEVARAAEQGLPIAVLPGERFREGAALGPGPGAVSLVQPTPNPNAAKVFLNWLLSRDGQIAWQKATRENSLRTDIPKDGLYPFDAPKPGGKYVPAGTEEYARLAPTDIADLITRALEKAGRA